jgi:hypothetical protein
LLTAWRQLTLIRFGHSCSVFEALLTDAPLLRHH